MRIKVYGYFCEEEKKYILEDEEGEVKYELKNGSTFNLDGDKYYCGYCGQSSGALFVAKEGVEPSSKGIEVLEDNTTYLMATTSISARNGLLKVYKPIYREDRLIKALKALGYIPQCLDIRKDLDEAEIPSSFIEGCNNYTEEKNWYSYEAYTDSTDYEDIRVGNQVCPTCSKYRTCKYRQKKTYRAYYNGTYSIVVKTNVRTGERKLQSIQITSRCDRNKIADLLIDIFSLKVSSDNTGRRYHKEEEYR